MKSPKGNRELLLHVIFLVVVAIIIFLPEYRKISLTPKNAFYPRINGIFEDYYLDLSTIKQGRSQFEETDQYTTEETVPNRTHLFYLLLGRLGKYMHLSDIDMYYIGIYGSLMIFYFYTYLLVKLVIPSSYVWLAMFLIFFAGPLPKYELLLFGKKIYLGTEWWTYMDVYHRLIIRPHHFLGMAMLVGSTYYLFRFLRGNKNKFLVFCSVFCSLAIISSGIPGMIFISALLVVMSIYLADRIFLNKKVMEGRILGKLAIMAVTVLPAVYFMQQEVNRGFPANVISLWGYNTFRPEQYPYLFSIFLISYGILLIFTIPAIFSIHKNHKFEHLFLVLLAVLPLILYELSVVGILRINKIRFVYSAPYVFVGLLATEGIIYILTKLVNKKFQRIAYYAIMAVILSNIFWGLKGYWWPELFRWDVGFKNIYIPKIYLQAIEFLNQNSLPYSNVLATFYTGGYLPAFGHNKVYIGHETSTWNFPQKWWYSENFFNQTLPLSEARDLLTKHKIEYVFWDQERTAAVYQSFLTPVYKAENIIIYKTDLKE